MSVPSQDFIAMPQDPLSGYASLQGVSFETPFLPAGPTAARRLDCAIGGLRHSKMRCGLSVAVRGSIRR